MLAQNEREIGTSSEIAFRRGFIQGADNVIAGLRRRLSEEDLRKVRAWMKELSKWRALVAPDQGAAPAFPQLDLPPKFDPRP
jgi:hypothetical protein